MTDVPIRVPLYHRCPYHIALLHQMSPLVCPFILGVFIILLPYITDVPIKVPPYYKCPHHIVLLHQISLLEFPITLGVSIKLLPQKTGVPIRLSLTSDAPYIRFLY